MSDENRSLLRGIQILKAFRPGSDLLGNGDIAERTGLARATVSRLTQTLVQSGLLQHDAQQRAYRLAAPVLSLAFAMKSGSPVLQAIAPLMREVSEKRKVNVGLAVADGDEMVYLESIRYNRKAALRNVVAGLRVPMELTSLGRAWLATVSPDIRKNLYPAFKARRRKDWPAIEAELRQAIVSVQTSGFCYAAWQPGVVAVSTPLQLAGLPSYVLNMSVNTEDELRKTALEMSTGLLTLRSEIEVRLAPAA